MKTTVEDLIKQHSSFSALTASERAEVSELCSNEEDFLRMKQFLLGVETMSQNVKTEASPSLKSSLDSVFAAKHPGVKSVWEGAKSVDKPVGTPVIPLYNRPWMRVAAVALLVLGTAPFFLWQSDSAEAESPQLAKLEESAPTDKVTDNGSANAVTDQPAAEGDTYKSQNQVSDKTPVTASLSAAGPGETAWASFDSSVESDAVAATEAPASANIASGSTVTLASGNAVTYSWTPGSATSTSTYSLGYTAPAANGVISSPKTPKTSAAKESYGFFAKDSQDGNSAMNRGKLADLNPSGDQAKIGGAAVNSRSMADQPSDLFDLLVPAF